MDAFPRPQPDASRASFQPPAPRRFTFQFVLAAILRRARRFVSRRMAARLERFRWRLTGYDVAAGPAESLGISARFHGRLAEGFRTHRVSTDTGPESAASAKPADGVHIIQGTSFSTEFPGRRPAAACDVSRIPWPVCDHYTPAGFDVPVSDQFLTVSTVPGGTLPDGTVPAVPGRRAVRRVHIPQLATLRDQPDYWRKQFQACIGMIDHAGNHQDIHLRSAVLTHAAAVGLPVCLSDDRGLRGFLPNAVLDLWCGTLPSDLLDLDRRQQIAQRQWAAVHDLLSMRPIWNQLLLASGRQPLPHRSLSVLLATRRPEMLPFWARLLAAQTWPNFEVIAAFHGSRFEPDAECMAREWLGNRLTVIRVPDRYLLGEVLNRATSAAAGDLIVKWDDDDLYSSEHLADLARTYEYAGATVVGKALEFVYLASRDTTLQLSLSAAERRSTHVTGNTLCLRRTDLQHLGGWQPQPRSVDTHLIDETIRQGGRLYQASGSGHLILRSSSPGHQHTWQARDRFLLRYTRARRPGVDVRFAGIDVSEELAAEWAYFRQQPAGSLRRTA